MPLHLVKQDIVMRKVVTLRVLECQLDMVQLSVGGDIHRQARPVKWRVSLRLT